MSAVGVGLAGYVSATSKAIVRHITLALPNYPRGAPPIRIVLFSDLHVQGPDMPPSRVGNIASEINALHPDVVIGAGDFRGTTGLGHTYSPAEAIAPLASLKPRLGVYAVLGNNDYESSASGGRAVRHALERAGVHVLDNTVMHGGPLAIGGLEGWYGSAESSMRRRERVATALRPGSGVKILVAHRPDEFRFAPSFVDLTLAGHTHCGQIVLPLIGALQTGSDFGTEYLCGFQRDGRKRLIVTAGLGTSKIPIRIGAPPDIWLIEVSGASGRGADR